MKLILRRVTALFLALLTALSLCLPASAATAQTYTHAPQAADNLKSVEQYEALLSSSDMQLRLQRQPLWYIRRLLTRIFNRALQLPGKRFNLTVNEEITAYCNYVKEHSDLDIVGILTNLPETKAPAELIVHTFGIDTDKMREAMFEKRDQYWGEGNKVLSGVYYFLGVYFSIMEKCEVTAIATNDPDVHEVILCLTYADGKQEELHPGIFINSVTGESYNRDGSGMVSIGFNCSIYDLIVYAPINAWMRDFGFRFLYDLLCYGAPSWMFNYTTRRFKFEYAGKDWMIQLWKGNYLITNGCEIGLYNRPKEKRGTYYECASDDDLLEMSMTLSHGDEDILSLGPEMHWWLNGFKMTKEQYAPSTMTMKARIVMRDRDMLNAFCDAIDRHYRHDVRYSVDGLAVSLIW